MKHFIFFLLCISLSFAAKGQSDFDIAQRWFNEVLYNPAAAGSNLSSGISLHTRNQWSGMKGAPTTLAASYDTYAKPISSGFGISILTDYTGLISTYNGRLIYAYYLRVNRRSVLSLGLSAGVTARSVQRGDPENPLDLTLSEMNLSTAYSPDFDFGFEFKGPFKFGATVRHLGVYVFSNEDDPVYRRFNHSINLWAYLSSRFNVMDMFSFEPMASFTYRDRIYRYEIGGLFYFQKLNNLNTYRDRVWIGAVYRTDHNIAFMAGMHITPKIRLGYSFGHGFGTVSSLAKFGTHEILIAYHFNRIFYKSSCPPCMYFKEH